MMVQRSLQRLPSHSLIPQTMIVARRCLGSEKRDHNALLWGENLEKAHAFVVKDNFATATGTTTCASGILQNYESPFDASAVRLLLEEGYKLRGKANLDEFGMGSSNTNSFFGAVSNPLYEHEERIPGGSSGGSAAAIAAGLAEFALGTDTGGSVRQPASHCGIVGFKPSYGRLSRWGVVAYAQSLDTVGILAKDLDVIERVYNILNQYDSKDPTSLPQETRDQISSDVEQRNLLRKSSYVFGIPQEFLIEELSEENTKKLSKVITTLIERGHSVKPVSVPSVKKALAAYYTIATAEAASNLSRYDGIRYGTSIQNVSSNQYVSSNRSQGFGKEVQRRIILGNYTLSSESGDHYLQATSIRQNLVEEFNRVFGLPNALGDRTQFNANGCDFLISPTTISRAALIDDYIAMENKNVVESYANDILTVPMSLAGLPTINLPITDTNSRISFQGIQVCGQFGDDIAVIEVGQELNTCLK